MYIHAPLPPICLNHEILCPTPFFLYIYISTYLTQFFIHYESNNLTKIYSRENCITSLNPTTSVANLEVPIPASYMMIGLE